MLQRNTPLAGTERLKAAFTSHPASVQESYLEHAQFAGAISLKLAVAAFAAGVHAVFPFLFEKTAGRTILDLAETMQQRGR